MGLLEDIQGEIKALRIRMEDMERELQSSLYSVDSEFDRIKQYHDSYKSDKDREIRDIKKRLDLIEEKMGIYNPTLIEGG